MSGVKSQYNFFFSEMRSGIFFIRQLKKKKQKKKEKKQYFVK